MHLGIKAKQVLSITSIVGAVVVILSLLHLATLARVEPGGEPRARRAAVECHLPARPRGRGRRRRSGTRRCAPIPALRSILESALCCARSVTFAAIADLHGVAVVHTDTALEDMPMHAGDDLVRVGSPVRAVPAQGDLQRLRGEISS